MIHSEVSSPISSSVFIGREIAIHRKHNVAKACAADAKSNPNPIAIAIQKKKTNGDQ